MPVKRRLTLILAIVVLTLLPAIVMVVITWAATGEPQGAATWASMPAIVAIAAAVAGGRRYAIVVAIVMACVAPVAIVAGQSPVSGAALMALLCITVGRMARFGLQKSALLVPVMLSWALIDPPAWGGAGTVDRLDTGYLLWMSLIFFIGGLLPALIVPKLMRNRPASQLQTHTRREAVTYTVMITTLVTVGTFWVLDNPQDFGGAFLIAILLVMAPIGTAQTIKPTIWRLIGTVAGSLLVVLLVSQVQSLGLIYLIGLVFIMVALFARLSGQAWVYYVFMVPATACLNATTLSQVGELGKQRVLDNLVGGVLVIAATVVAIGYSHWASRHGEAAEADDEVTPLVQPSPL
jgi:MFS family permease